MGKYDEMLKRYKVGMELGPLAYDLINELVEFRTPKKASKDIAGYFCPTCNLEVYNMAYCANCGQCLKLDRSDSNG